ncbi:hypothetical protein S245_032117 [Arachis hypogaea]|nr:uncharacterized protein DS421_10g289510 [Arachis hypogaea]
MILEITELIRFFVLNMVGRRGRQPLHWRLDSRAICERVEVSEEASVWNEGSVEGSMQIPNPTSHDTQTENPTSRATTNVSSQPKAQQPFRRPKQTIRRPQVQGSLDADMTAATTSPAASEMFKFIPTPGLNQSKKK